MDKKQLKKVLKPMIKECIHELLLSEGILSGIISEVAQGLGTNLNETRPTSTKPSKKNKKSVNETFRQRMREDRKPNKTTQRAKSSLMESIGADAYGGVDLFEGTEPMKSAGSPGETNVRGALSDMDPSDPGVDINGIMSIANRDWSKLI